MNATTYRIRLDCGTVLRTTDAAVATRHSHAGRRVTATTRGAK